jgi:cytochrome c oxidase subunit IV
MEHQESIQTAHSIQRTPEESRAIRKKIFSVTAILSIVTIVEVAVGIYFSKSHVGDGTAWTLIKWFYIILTLVKAGYIVMVFMHLGDESKNLRLTILLPTLFIIYLIFILVFEGSVIIQYFENLLK